MSLSLKRKKKPKTLDWLFPELCYREVPIILKRLQSSKLQNGTILYSVISLSAYEVKNVILATRFAFVFTSVFMKYLYQELIKSLTNTIFKG